MSVCSTHDPAASQIFLLRSAIFSILESRAIYTAGMQLRFVESFYWAAKLRSVSSAADKLYVTQSALSARILALEEELGASLLDRSIKQFRLTPAGITFLEYAEKLLALQLQAIQDVGASSRTGQSFRIGVLESGIHSWLMPMLNALRQAKPELALELTVESSPLLVEQFRRGALDVVFATQATSGEQVVSQAFNPMPMVFVGDKSLHKKKLYTLKDLAQEEIITFQRGSQPHNALIALLRSHQLVAKRIHAVSSISAMTPMIKNGLGIATLPRQVAKGLSKAQGLRVLPVEHNIEALPIFASYRSDPSSDNSALNVLLTTLQTQLRGT